MAVGIMNILKLYFNLYDNLCLIIHNPRFHTHHFVMTYFSLLIVEI